MLGPNDVAWFRRKYTKPHAPRGKIVPCPTHNTKITNLHNDREWRKTRKPQVGEGGTTCITLVLKTQLKLKVK